MKIYFVTGNKDKLREAQLIWPDIEGINIDLEEIQEIDEEKIIESKLREAIRKKPGIPLMVEDQSLVINGMNGLPGPLIKWFVKSMSLKGMAKLAEKMGNGKAEAKTIVGYANKDGEINYFKASIKGKIVPPRGTIGWGWDYIFQPDGDDKTFAEMTMNKKNKLSMRRIAIEKLKKFVKEKEQVYTKDA